MKKRIIALAAVVALFAIARAQEARPERLAPAEAPFYDTSAAKNLVELNPHISVGVSSLAQNYSQAVPGVSDMIVSPGVLGGVGLDVRFNLRKSIGLATGLEIDYNRSGYAMSIVTGANGSISTIYTHNRFYCLTVPVYMSWRFNIGRRMAWNTDLGAYVSYGLGGSMKTSGYTAGENDLGQPVVTHASHSANYYDGEQPLINGVKRVDYGPRLATGLIYKRCYTLNAVLQVSLPNQAVNHGVLDVQYRHVSLLFQLGYLF